MPTSLVYTLHSREQLVLSRGQAAPVQASTVQQQQWHHCTVLFFFFFCVVISIRTLLNAKAPPVRFCGVFATVTHGNDH